jgi:hypothetical protein
MARTIEEAENLINLYEQNGAAKLFYALNRKAGEMADMLNKYDLATIDIADPKDKSFDRMKIVWNDSAGIAIAVKTLGETAGITNNELKDTNTSVYKKITTAESMADSIGELAGKQKT